MNGLDDLTNLCTANCLDNDNQDNANNNEQNDNQNNNQDNNQDNNLDNNDEEDNNENNNQDNDNNNQDNNDEQEDNSKNNQLVSIGSLIPYDKKKKVLLDINFYFKRLDKVITQIEEYKQQLLLKQREAEDIVTKINDNLLSINAQFEEEVCTIDEEIDTLDDLIFVAKKYGSLHPTKKYTVDTKILYRLIEPLENLRNIVGMTDVKNQLVDQILTSLQNLYDDDILFHTIIKGPPGVGKTMLAKLLGEIYLRMGILKNDADKLIFKVVKRSDLIGKYLGHTAVKTQELIDSCVGGVLFIDEVYSLGNDEKKDSFSKECIDTINLNLLEKKNFICIIAGYPDEIERCFFAYNSGLKRRFPFSHEINKYSSIELRQMFCSKIKKSGWVLSEEIESNMSLLDNFISKNIGSFKNYGGDIDILLLNSKIVHGRRVFGKDLSLKMKLTLDDIKKGFEKSKLSKSNINEKDAYILRTMYT